MVFRPQILIRVLNHTRRGQGLDIHLPMSPDDGSKQLPRPPSTIDPEHPKDLEKPESSEGGRGKHFSTGPETQNDGTGSGYDDV